jgi:hypothetical protein
MALEQNAREDVKRAVKAGVIDVLAQAAYDEAISHGWRNDPEVQQLESILKSGYE